MEDIGDFITEAGRGIARLLYYLIRFLLWLVWEIGIEFISWSVGWVIVKLVTCGHYPKHGILEQDDAPLITALVIELLGLFSLILLSSWLYSLAF